MADFKPCGNFKARYVLDGHLTKEPADIVPSGLDSMRNFKLAMFTAEPNNFQLWGADDENAYLQALTKKQCTAADPEAEELQEHMTHFYQKLKLCSCCTKPQPSQNHQCL